MATTAEHLARHVHGMEYAIAAALLDGRPGFASFTDAGARRTGPPADRRRVRREAHRPRS